MREHTAKALGLGAIVVATTFGCGESDDGGTTAGTGGAPASGGAPAAGGTGGEQAAGGASGGTPASGGSAPTDGCSATTWPATGRYTTTIDGTTREYAVTIPESYDPSQEYKVVSVWHGLGGDLDQVVGNQFWGYYGMLAEVDDRTILVAGQGLGTAEAPDQTAWRNTDGEDVAFVRDMVNWLTSSYCIDTNRIFATGMSYGGIMSNILGCEMNDVFRAIAPIAGAGPNSFMGSPSAPECQGAIAALLVHGTADETVNFTSGEESRDVWLGLSGCSADAPAAVDPTEYCVEYQGCDPASPVVWCVHDGGHTIPDWSAAAIWTFFSRF